MKKWIKRLCMILPLLYMILIWTLSSMPDDAVVKLPSNSVDRFFKESMHLIEFGILHLLFILALLVNGKLTVATHVVAAVFASFYGFLDEIHQAFVPWRSATVVDAVKDVLGVLVVYLLIQRVYFVKKEGYIGQKMHAFEAWIRSEK
ncbi:hypothetical protein E2R51_09610 [Jeotgalibacillus sp. S-D1]|uniref:VanZ family protein n=1 Tax=Jeotgalibacillus sp. S-D1 TaxID=2552189 RepID=UPI00105A8071|nr:VanZ family protein [Jeotgalibacillus sp. S-D1]TDL32910.1 hypothetical protein E2R51_09610 [Jeotgalibacillus sp. S-D1]